MSKKGAHIKGFNAISIKHAVAVRFRIFSKRISKSHTETLILIMDFFEWHGFLPTQRFERKLIAEILKNRKRTEANIAILRDIEQTQTKPLSIQMDLLFEGRTKQGPDTKLVERKFAKKTEGDRKKETTVPKANYQKVKRELRETRKEFRWVLDKVVQTKSGLGRPYLKLELSLSDFHRILTDLKKE